MTGRATIGGKTRKAIIWEAIHARPMSVLEAWHHLGPRLRLTYTATDKVLRDMMRDGSLTRTRTGTGTQGSNDRLVYVYAAVGDAPPADGRAITAVRVLAAWRARGGKRDFLTVATDDEEVDDWPRGRVVSRESGVPPEIPTLMDLLSRRS